MIQWAHPDENRAGFVADKGWCKTCGRTLRLGETLFYHSQGSGPYCSDSCLDVQGGVWRVYDADVHTIDVFDTPYDTTST